MNSPTGSIFVVFDDASGTKLGRAWGLRWGRELEETDVLGCDSTSPLHPKPQRTPDKYG